MLAASRCELVRAHAPIGGGDTPLRFDPAGFQHPLQGGIERAFLDVKQIIRGLLDVLGQGVTMQRLALEGLQNHHLQGAGKEVALVVCLHGRNINKA